MIEFRPRGGAKGIFSGSIELRLGAALVRLPPNPDMGMIHLPTFPGSARGAARVVAGNSENPSPPEHLSAGRSASQVVATLPSAGRGSQEIKPHLLYVAVQNPNMCTCCVAIEKNRANRTSDGAIGKRAYLRNLHNKRVKGRGRKENVRASPD